MTRNISTQKTQQLVQSATFHFDCFEYVGSAGSRQSDRDERKRKRDVIQSLVLRGIDLLNSDDPPRTKEEAVRQITQIPPFMRFMMLILGTVFPQYSLAISVAEWLWDQFASGESVTVTSTGEVH